MRIGITGGGGFIGRHVIDKVLELGHNPVLFDIHFQEGIKNFDKDLSKFEYYIGDINDVQAIKELVDKVDVVVHLAGLLGTPETLESFDKIVKTNQTNILGTLNVLEALRLQKKKGVLLKTGNDKSLSPYPISRHAAAQYALMYNKEFGTKVAVIKGYVAYGEGQKHYPQKVFPTFMMKAINNEPIPIFGDGENVHDCIYAGDLAEMTLDAILTEHNHYDDVIEGGSGFNYSVNEIAKLVIEATNSESQIEYLPMRSGEPKHNKVVIEKKSNWLKDYSPKKVEDVIDQTAKWYKEVYSKYAHKYEKSN